VSVGHENESSLLIIDDGVIITTDPKNEFYSGRAQELNGPEINSLQETILTSDDLEENEGAYKQLIKLSPCTTKAQDCGRLIQSRSLQS
jgi:hypothetical protein